MIVDLLFVLVLLAVVAVHYGQGLWSNLIRFVIVLSAALLATNFFEPLGARIESAVPWLWHYADFLAAWFVFSVALLALTYLGSKLSTTNVRFTTLVDKLGGALFAAAAGWVVVCFLAMTLHAAPLGRTPFFGYFRAEEPMFFGYHPDRIWLAFAQKCSTGVYANGVTFDPQGDYLLRMAARRDQFEQAATHWSVRPK